MRNFQFFCDSCVHDKQVDIIVVQCENCWTIYQNPAYSSKGFEVLFSEAGCSYGASAEHINEQIDWLSRQNLLAADKCLLDIGCYDGYFLSKTPASMIRIGVDIDRQAIEKGIRKYEADGIKLVQGDFNTFNIDQKPDIITMFHVLEHLPDPVATLVNLRNISGRNTKLVVEVPVLENGFTNDINGFLTVQHMIHFSRHSFTAALSIAGWEVVQFLEQSDYNGYRILARPAKAVKEVAGEVNDKKVLEAYLMHWQKVINLVNMKITRLNNAEKILIWGGGFHTELLYQLTDLFKLNKAFAIVDSDPLKQGKSWRGINIYPPEVISELDWKYEWLLVSSYGGQPAMVNAAKEMGVPEDRIVSLYDKFRVY